MDGAYPYPESIPPQPGSGTSPQPIPGGPPPGGAYGAPYGGPPLAYPGQSAPAYPGALPPPVTYPPAGSRRGKRVLLIVAALAVAAAVVGGIVFAVAGFGSDGLTDNKAKSTIQGYLDALLHQDRQTVARHALCGLYDGVKDHSTDLAVANLASDAFRKQFSQAEVTSIDQVVMLSPNQAQVLFTMKVAPSGRLPRSSAPKNNEVQAVAQLLVQPGETLVCSYLPRPSDSL